MSDTLLRQWTMLRHIPRHPRRTTVSALHERLREQGYPTTERTIQRDLQELSGQLFGLAVDDRSRPHGWYWDRDAAQFDIPGMEPQTALAFKLAEHFAGPLMAPATLQALSPYFRRAEQVLADTSSPVRAWPDKVQAITRGQALIPPTVDPEVFTTVYDALFNDRQFQARYHRRHDGAVKDYVVNPLGVVFRDGVVYLVCTLYDYDDVLQLALHRLLAAEPLETRARRPEGFDLGHYVDDGGLNFKLSDGPLTLELLLDPETAFHLRETPLSQDQVMEDTADGHVRLTATVADTAQVRWWLLGLGDQVEVISPQSLRETIATTLRQAAARYD